MGRLRVPPCEVKLPEIEAQIHRRFLKTHLPVDTWVFSPKARYIYIGRDPCDVIWRLFNHHSNANQMRYDALNKTPGLVGPEIGRPPADPVTYFRDWLANDRAPFWSFWENARSWWAIRHLLNVHFVLFADLKTDIESEIRKVAAFLDIEPSNWQTVLDHCTFDYMKAHAGDCVPLGGALWEGGAQTFLHKGTNGRWQGVLPEADRAALESRFTQELGGECAAWMKAGGKVSLSEIMSDPTFAL